MPRSLSSLPREASAQAMTGPAAYLERVRQTARRDQPAHQCEGPLRCLRRCFPVRAGGAARNGARIILKEFLDERRQEHIGATSIRRRGLP